MPVALRQAPEGGETFEYANPNYGTAEPLEPTDAPFEGTYDKLARLRREQPDNKAYWHATKWAEEMEEK
jgi:hypothetical protein